MGDMFNKIIAVCRSLYRAMSDELRLVAADGGILLIVAFAPIIYTSIYSMAYGSEVVGSLPIAIVDSDNTPQSRDFIRCVEAGNAVDVVAEPTSMHDAQHLFYDDAIYGVIYIPSGYGDRVLAGESADVSLVVDGSHLLIYKHIMEHVVAVAATLGVELMVMDFVAKGEDAAVVQDFAMPVVAEVENVYNPQLGYGTFVMPSIFIVIIQQTLLIGVSMAEVRRARRGQKGLCGAVVTIIGRLCAYLLMYATTSIFILGVIWQLFDLPFVGRIFDVVLFMLLYIAASTSLALLLSGVFRRREAPLMLLLWSSVPILLLAGVSYPREAFPEWMYIVGRLFPSSSAVDAFVGINTMGVGLECVSSELITLLFLLLCYTLFAILLEMRGGCIKNNKE